MKLRKLYSEPKVFEPIEFLDGVNLVLGETTTDNEKTNGVGKSLAIEFLNFGLLKRYKDSRVSRIPEGQLPDDLCVCLDFELAGRKITCRRTPNEADTPTLITDGEAVRFASLSDANNYLTSLMFGSAYDENLPSFRAMMGPLIRDERSEFKSIINCFDTDQRIPPNYAPHLYLLHTDPSPYREAQSLAKEMDKIRVAKGKAKENIEAITNKNVAEAKADLNELTSQVEQVQKDVDNLENVEGFDTVKDEIIEIEDTLEVQRSRQAVLKSELLKIRMFQGDNYIDSEEVADLYNQFKAGLGDLIAKDLAEVTAFKKKIDDFQRSLIDNRKGGLEQELDEIRERILALDKRYKDKVSILDQEGLLKSLKKTIAIHQQKVEEHSALSAFIRKFSDYDKDGKDKKRERDEQIYLLESYVSNAKETIESVEQNILDIHEYVFGNRKSSFEVKVSKNKEIVKFELRTDADGSHSINREKVFLYDVALLINEMTGDRHPGILVHDNIFDVDQDTLIKSLNFLSDKSSLLNNKQYILTINRDKFADADLQKLKLDLDEYARASYTKANRFLDIDYQELSA